MYQRITVIKPGAQTLVPLDGYNQGCSVNVLSHRSTHRHKSRHLQVPFFCFSVLTMVSYYTLSSSWYRAAAPKFTPPNRVKIIPKKDKLRLCRLVEYINSALGEICDYFLCISQKGKIPAITGLGFPAFDILKYTYR